MAAGGLHPLLTLPLKERQEDLTETSVIQVMGNELHDPKHRELYSLAY